LFIGLASGITALYCPGFSLVTAARAGIGVALGGFLGEAQVAAAARRFRILGVVHGQGAEIIAAVQAVHDHLDFLSGIGFILRLVILEVMDLRIGGSGHQDAGEVILRLDQVEFRLVGVVVIRNVLVGHVDLGGDFFVQHFVHGEGTAQIALEIVHRNLLFLQPGFKLFLGVGRLDLVQLAVHLFVGGQQSELLRPAHQDFVVNQFLQNAETQAGGLFSDRHLVRPGGLVLVILFHVSPVDFAAIHRGGDIIAGTLGSAAGKKNHEEDGKKRNRFVAQEMVYFQIKSSAVLLDAWSGPRLARHHWQKSGIIYFPAGMWPGLGQDARAASRPPAPGRDPG
jgi:hypothetical protein